MAKRRSKTASDTPELTSPPVRLVRSASLTAQVEQILRQFLADGRLVDGRFPTEVELAEQLGVSRETVRRAAGVLEKEGLLVKIPSRGTFAQGSERLPRMTAEQPLVLGYLQTDYAALGGAEQVVNRTIASLMLQGASEETGRAGGQIMSRHASPSHLDLAWRQLRSAVAIHGLICASCGEEKLLRRVLGLGVPVVLVDHDLHLPRFSSVRDDSFEGARQAVRHLVSLGHRRIALIHWQEADLNPWRLRGYRQELRAAGLQRKQKWEFSIALTEAGARQAVEKWLALSPRPTALYCFNNTIARFVMEELGRQQIRVPDDVSIMGAGGEEVQGLTCTKIDWHGMGRAAVKMLLAKIGNKDAEPEHLLFPHQLETGRTAARV